MREVAFFDVRPEDNAVDFLYGSRSLARRLLLTPFAVARGTRTPTSRAATS